MYVEHNEHRGERQQVSEVGWEEAMSSAAYHLDFRQSDKKHIAIGRLGNERGVRLSSCLMGSPTGIIILEPACLAFTPLDICYGSKKAAIPKCENGQESLCGGS